MLNGKTAVITGSTRGIGLSIAIKFLENGANVVICGSKQESVDKALSKLKECFPAEKRQFPEACKSTAMLPAQDPRPRRPTERNTCCIACFPPTNPHAASESWNMWKMR